MKRWVYIFWLSLIAFSGVSATPHTDTHYYILSPTKNKVVAINALTEERTDIPVGQSPKDMEIYKNKGYVINRKSHDMSIVDLETHQVIQTLPVGRFPSALMIYDHYGYIANKFSKKITVVDLDSPAVIQTIKVGSEPLSIHRDGHVAYVVHGNSTEIIAIDLRTNLICDRISIEGWYSGSLTFYQSKAYVSHFHESRIDVIDLKSHSVFHIGLETPPSSMVISSNRLYVLNSLYDKISVIDLNQDQFIHSIFVGRESRSMIVRDGFGYVLKGVDLTISVINLESRKVIATLPKNKILPLNATATHLYLGTKQICPLFHDVSHILRDLASYALSIKKINWIYDFRFWEIEARNIPAEETFLDLMPLDLAIETLETWEFDAFSYLTFLSMLKSPERIIQSKYGRETIVPKCYRALYYLCVEKEFDVIENIAVLMVQLDFPYISRLATYHQVILASTNDGMEDAFD